MKRNKTLSCDLKGKISIMKKVMIKCQLGSRAMHFPTS